MEGRTADNILKTSVQYVKGVGEARAKTLAKLGLFTVGDVITHFPRDYEDRSSFKRIMELEDGDTCAFYGTVISNVSENRPRKGLSIYKMNIRDDTGIITAIWFNQPYIKTVFSPGEEYVFYGKISKRAGVFQVQNPVFEKAGSDEMKKISRIVPVYPSTSQLSQNILRSVISNALKIAEDKLVEPLPGWIRQKYHLSEYSYSIKNIHFPDSEYDFKNARYRLAFEELLILQLGLMSIKNSLDQDKAGIVFNKLPVLEEFIARLPFRLTGAQKRVLIEIEGDMASKKVMNRLIQGDVGSGKTIVAVLALFIAAKNGYQGTFMVPTEILAQQHFCSLSELFEKWNVKVDMLTGSQTKKQKEEILKRVSEGETDILIGTHALIEENVVFKKLGLVITDEQHRFGVRQRALLAQKGENPDVIVMTATPIPRTLALILYGDLDISIIDELPPGRKPIKTYAVDESMRYRINRFITQKVGEGRQVYIVCPLVEESDTLELKSAVEQAENIARDFENISVGLIHGKMRPKEKEETMRRFVIGDISILVSTTVIEVGVNVPNSTVMVIENAERFGLAQLHQLRGRVGRGAEQSFCILYNQGKSEVSKERLKVMEKSNDGFYISEKDLELRGPGEFFGTRQHGIPDLKIANLYRDMDILKASQQAALELLKRDRGLRDEENSKIRNILIEKFRDKLTELTMN